MTGIITGSLLLFNNDSLLVTVAVVAAVVQ